MTATLQIEFRPDPGWVAITSMPAGCSGANPTTLSANSDYQHQLQFRVSGVLPGGLGVLALGSTTQVSSLPLPSTCQLLTDPFFVRLLSAEELAGAPVFCATHGLQAPFQLYVQAAIVTPAPATIWTSNRLGISRQ